MGLMSNKFCIDDQFIWIAPNHPFVPRGWHVKGILKGIIRGIDPNYSGAYNVTFIKKSIDELFVINPGKVHNYHPNIIYARLTGTSIAHESELELYLSSPAVLLEQIQIEEMLEG